MMRRETLKLTRRRLTAFVGLAFITLLPTTALTRKDSTPEELRAMVEAERAFSRASTERG